MGHELGKVVDGTRADRDGYRVVLLERLLQLGDERVLRVQVGVGKDKWLEDRLRGLFEGIHDSPPGGSEGVYVRDNHRLLCTELASKYCRGFIEDFAADFQGSGFTGRAQCFG